MATQQIGQLREQSKSVDHWLQLDDSYYLTTTCIRNLHKWTHGMATMLRGRFNLQKKVVALSEADVVEWEKLLACMDAIHVSVLRSGGALAMSISLPSENKAPTTGCDLLSKDPVSNGPMMCAPTGWAVYFNLHKQSDQTIKTVAKWVESHKASILRLTVDIVAIIVRFGKAVSSIRNRLPSSRKLSEAYLEFVNDKRNRALLNRVWRWLVHCGEWEVIRMLLIATDFAVASTSLLDVDYLIGFVEHSADSKFLRLNSILGFVTTMVDGGYENSEDDLANIWMHCVEHSNLVLAEDIIRTILDPRIVEISEERAETLFNTLNSEARDDTTNFLIAKNHFGRFLFQFQIFDWDDEDSCPDFIPRELKTEMSKFGMMRMKLGRLHAKGTDKITEITRLLDKYLASARGDDILFPGFASLVTLPVEHPEGESFYTPRPVTPVASTVATATGVAVGTSIAATSVAVITPGVVMGAVPLPQIGVTAKRNEEEEEEDEEGDEEEGDEEGDEEEEEEEETAAQTASTKEEEEEGSSEEEEEEKETASSKRLAKISRSLAFVRDIFKTGPFRTALLPILFKYQYPTLSIPLDHENVNPNWMRDELVAYYTTQFRNAQIVPPILKMIDQGDTLIVALHGAARRKSLPGMPGKHKGPRGGKALAPSVKHMTDKFKNGELHTGRGDSRRLLDPATGQDRKIFGAMAAKRQIKAVDDAKKRRKKKGQ